MGKAIIDIRPAALSDLDGIMELEAETFGGCIGPEAAAAKSIMEKRISLCNDRGQKWFWIAIWKNKVVGHLILQPTQLQPDDCTSWAAATDNGTLSQTFISTGNNIYVVSFTASEKAPSGVSPLLAHAGFVEWLNSRKQLFMFCSRMPGFASEQEQTGMSAREYWRRTRPDGSPEDWMMHMYWEMTGGARPVRLLENGFPVDRESGGHGVLFAADNPVAALSAISHRIHEAGVADSRKMRSS